MSDFLFCDWVLFANKAGCTACQCFLEPLQIVRIARLALKVGSNIRGEFLLISLWPVHEFSVGEIIAPQWEFLLELG